MAQTKSTVNEKEINNFNKLVDQWWSGMRTLHKLNDVRIPALIENLQQNGYISKEVSESEKPLLGLEILDIGSGGGILCEPLAMLGANVTGLDAANELIECAKLHAKDNKNISNNLTYICDTIEHFAEQNPNKFDVIIASEIVEHVNEIDLFLESCIKTVKPKGAIYITTINRTMRSWLIAKILYEYVLNVIGRGRHEWNKFVTPEEISEILNKYDCTIIKTSGWEYNYFQTKFTFCADLSVFYYTFAIKN